MSLKAEPIKFKSHDFPGILVAQVCVGYLHLLGKGVDVDAHMNAWLISREALEWAAVAQRALVALRDYFTDEPDAPHAAGWRRSLVELVGEDVPAPPAG